MPRFAGWPFRPPVATFIADGPPTSGIAKLSSGFPRIGTVPSWVIVFAVASKTFGPFARPIVPRLFAYVVAVSVAPVPYALPVGTNMFRPSFPPFR